MAVAELAPFVGRRAEWDRVVGAWRAAVAADDLRVLLVGGEPGIGKTRLVTEVASALKDEGTGMSVLYGRADDPSAPFQAWSMALRELGFVEALRAISRPPADPSTGRTLLFGAAADAIAVASPAVVVLDDLQWADDSSLALVRHLVRGTASGALLLVLVYRDIELDRRSTLGGLIADLATDHRASRMSIVGLTTEEIGELTGRDDADLLRQRSGGNPFLVRSLVGYTGDGPPPEVADVIAHRVEQLDELARRAIAIASVCGRQVSPRIVDAVGGEQMLDGLDACLDAGLLVAVDQDTYEFVHDLVRECVLAGMSPARRAQLHRDVAVALRAAGVDEAEVDRHLLDGGGPASLKAAIAAADRARAALAYETAASDRATAYTLATDPETRFDVAMARAEDLALAGTVDGELEALQDAARCARELDDPRRMAAAVARMPLVFFASADALVTETLDRLPAGDSADRARVLIRQFYEATNRSHPDDVATILDDALDMAARVGDNASLARGVVVRSIFFADSVTDEDLDFLARHENAMAEVFGTRTLRRAHAIRVTRRMTLGDADGARREVQRLADGGLRTASQWTIAEWRAMEAFLAGRFDDARRLAVEADTIGHALGEELAEPNRRILELQIAIERGDTSSAIDDGPLLVGGLREQHTMFDAHIAAASGDLDQARRLIDDIDPQDAARVLRWPMLLFTYAAVVVLVGDRERAGVLYDAITQYSGTVVMPPLYPNVCLGAADRLLGLLAECADRPDDAWRHLARALEIDVRVGADVWAAHDRYHLGRLLLGDEPERAIALLDAAVSEARRLGMRPLADAVAAARDVAIFRPDAGGWLLVYDGTAIRLPARRGLAWLAQLLAAPGEELATLDLIGGGSWDRPPVLDARAKAQYRARLRDLDHELDDAAARNDLAAGDRARLERDALVDELARAVGRSGRDRATTADSERARINVTRAVRRAIDEIRRAHPHLAEHLDATIHTGLFCSYTPDPRAAPTWRTRQ